MLMDEAPAAIAGVGVIVTGVLGYLTGRRKNSGSVDTTDAAKLWAQVDIHIKRLDGLIATQSLTISAQGARLAELAVELHQKDERIIHLESVNGRLTVRVSELETELEKVKDRERRVAETLADKEKAS